MTMITRETALGQEFAGKRKTLTRERLWAFSGGSFGTPGWPKKNIHTDVEFAERAGFSKVYASGTQYMGHLAELMIDLFGEQWLSGGRISNVKLIKPVTEGDTVQAKAKVRSREQTGAGVAYTLDIWCENQDGDKVLVGTAQGCV